MANGRLSLHIPTYDELIYKQKLQLQPETMSYNKGYNLSFDGYHRDTGCIDFPESEWQGFFNRWVGNEPERFFAYLVNENENFIGEVNFHYNKSMNAHCIGIVIEAKYRGKGYCVEGLKLLIQKARECGAKKLRNEFELNRKSALAGHLSAGFVQVGVNGNCCILEKVL
jgi:hypothetical protein